MDKPSKAPNINPKIKIYVGDTCNKAILTLFDKHRKKTSENQLLQEDHTSPVTVNSIDIQELPTQANYLSIPILNNIIANLTPIEVIGEESNKQNTK
ncbi:20340_t:CDS:2 [Dentiscutata erythropus]|uniref:20340_t:CDS:1 n=1 Tax=Dentiscutata erythropus TaxID=1348616 RepID=A0A9N9HV95_9GLOM|nr:20340_t:CDS:2 [Dentiscutata erythropus]